MINFRFHLVSLIAVFLALGLGILVGSTVVDQVIVDRLDREIRSVSHESNQLNSDNSKLQDEISKLNDFLHKSSAYAVEHRLTGIPVAIVAEKGIDAGSVTAALDSVRAAGASVPGVLWLDDKWQLNNTKDLAALQTATRTTGNVAITRLAAMRALVTRLGDATSIRPRPPVDVIEPLRSAGFLDFTDGKRSALAAFPGRTHAARVLVLTGTDSHLAATDTMVDLVQALTESNVASVVGEVYDDKGGATTAPKRGSALEPVLGNPAFSKQISTLDDAELPQGALTAVVALEQIADGTIGHYGYGEGAGETIPPLPS